MKLQGTDGQFIFFTNGNRALAMGLVVAMLVIAVGLNYENQFTKLIEIWTTKPVAVFGLCRPKFN